MNKIGDLGEMNSPVILFGGPYSNFQALEALYERAEVLGISGCQIISAGDVVAYCADGQKCVTLIRRNGTHVVAGNCEKQLAAGSEECGCGFDDGSTCAILSDGWYPYALRTISQDDKNWMGGLPDAISFTHHGKSYCVLHGGVSDISKFLWSISGTDDFQSELDLMDRAYDGIFAAHSGLSFDRSIGGTRWVNVGAIGMPENDGDPRTVFAVLENGSVRFERLQYDYEAAANAMEDAGLTQGYQTALRTGFWPSEDVLPQALRRKNTHPEEVC